MNLFDETQVEDVNAGIDNKDIHVYDNSMAFTYTICIQFYIY